MKTFTWSVPLVLDTLALPKNLEAYDRYGLTALNFAALHGHGEVTNRLIQAGVNIESITKYKQTSLILAVKYRFPSIVDTLIEAKANLEAKDHWEETALTTAIAIGNKGNMEMVQRLVLAGARINPLRENERIPLIAALLKSKKEMVQYLIEQGANINSVFDGDVDYLFHQNPAFEQYMEKHLQILTPENRLKWNKYRLRKMFS